MSAQFCYWDAKTHIDLLIIIINQGFVSSLFFIAFIRLPALHRLYFRGIGINVIRIVWIHFLVIAWALTQSAVNYYSISVAISLPDQVTNKEMMNHSANYAILSSFPGYLIQTLFATICYTFCSNLIAQTDIRIFPTYSIKFVKILKVYYFFRLSVWFTAVLLLVLAEQQSVSTFSRAQFGTLIFDSAFINIFLIASIRIFVNRLRHSSFRQLKAEYLLMFSCSVVRIIVDSAYIFVNHQDQSGFCVSEKNFTPSYTAVYNVVGNYLIHFLPVAIILKIYSFDHRKLQESDQLISFRRSQSVNSSSSSGQPNSLN